MKNLLIDLSSLKENTQNAVLGIKYFLSKNGVDHVTVIADSNNTVTINNHKRVTIAQLENDEIEIDPLFKDIKEKNLRILFTLIKKDKYNSFVTFTPIDELKPYIDKYFVKKTSPLVIASYANYKTHKCTLFGDISFNKKPTQNDFSSYLRELKDYATNVYNFKETKFKIMTSCNHELEKSFKDDKDYQGILSPSEIYSSDVDILLTDAHTCWTTINSIDGAIKTYDKYIKDSLNRNVGYKIFSAMFKSMMSGFHLQLDQKLTSGGMTLLGYDKKVIFLNKDVVSLGIKVSLDNSLKFN